MRRGLATGRIWGLPVAWFASDPEPAVVQATVVHVIHRLPVPEEPERDAIEGSGHGTARS